MADILTFPARRGLGRLRHNYRRKPLVWNEGMRVQSRPIEAWEIDSTLDPDSEAGREIIYAPA